MEIPYVPEHWKNLKLEFTDEYINRINKIRKIEKLNDMSKSPKSVPLQRLIFSTNRFTAMLISI